MEIRDKFIKQRNITEWVIDRRKKGHKKSLFNQTYCHSNTGSLGNADDCRPLPVLKQPGRETKSV